MNSHCKVILLAERLKLIFSLLFYSRGKKGFLRSVPRNAKLLDVGCGNSSPLKIKSQRPDVFYVGLDVSNYNQKINPNIYADQYKIVSPGVFAEEIVKFSGKFDAVISSHNIEHCYDQENVLCAMLSSVKDNGVLYLSFPSEESVYFPKRRNTLNFYDDPSHARPVNYQKVLKIITNNNFRIDFCIKRYRPFFLWFLGLIFEPFARVLNRNMPFAITGAFYGFETIIWASRKR
jgi:SAM-dependent methyltransferase